MRKDSDILPGGICLGDDRSSPCGFREAIPPGIFGRTTASAEEALPQAQQIEDAQRISLSNWKKQHLLQVVEQQFDPSIIAVPDVDGLRGLPARPSSDT